MTRTPSLTRFAVALSLLFALCTVACNRDPNYAKKQWLESGNKYFARSRYKEALIMYRKALSKDPKFGEAYYRLALALQATGQQASMVGVLRRSTELLPKGSAEWNDSALKLGEILVNAAVMQDPQNVNKPLMDEVALLQMSLDQKAPNSFEDYRLRGEVKHAEAAVAVARRDVPAAKKSLEDSIGFLRKSLSAKPNDEDTAIALAHSLAIYGQLAESEQIYKGLIDHNKILAVGYLELYRLFLGQKRNGEAEEILKRAIANIPKDFSFRTLLAAYYFSQKNRPEADRILDGMKAQYKDFPEAFLTVGDFYARLGDYDLAIKQYQEGINKDSGKKSDYQKRIIEILLRQNKTETAYAKILEMLKDNPKDPDARAMKASFLLDRGDIAQAITEFQDVVTAKPDNVVARYNLGRAYSAKGDLQPAIQQYQEAIKLRSDYFRPRIGLAEAEIQTGSYDAALQAVKDAEALSPNDPSAKLLEAVADMRMGKRADSRKILTDLVAKYPKFSEASLELGNINMLDKDYPAAREAFAKSYSINKVDLRGLVGEAETYVMTNQPQQALALFKTEVDAQPNRSDLLREFANLKLRTQQFDAALADYRVLVERYKTEPRELAKIYSAIGQLEVRKGDLNASIENLKKAQALEPNSVPTLNFLAQVYQRLNRNNEAIDTYRAVLAINPENAEALNDLAFRLADSGANLDEALTLANRAKQRLPNVLQVNDTIAMIYTKKNLTEQAIEIFKEITTKSPAEPTYHYHYCMALAAKGDKVEAKKECDAALSNKPTPPDAEGAKQLLAKLQ